MIAGRVWKFGDNINTDLMLPGALLYKPEEEQMRHLFAANRPGWIDQVRKGDIIVAGENFGTGSARPGARSMRNAGIACLIADSINGLFFRSCISYGFLAVECPGATDMFAEGDLAHLTLEDFQVSHPGSGERLQARRIPPQLMEIVTAGGIYPLLESAGLVGSFDT